MERRTDDRIRRTALAQTQEFILLGAQHRHLQPVGIIEAGGRRRISPGDPQVIHQAVAHGLHDPVGQRLPGVCCVAHGLVERIDPAGSERHAHGTPVVVKVDIGKPHSPRNEAERGRQGKGDTDHDEGRGLQQAALIQGGLHAHAQR